MELRTALPDVARQAGEYVGEETAVPLWHDYVRLGCARASLPDVRARSILTCALDVSYDGGKTWIAPFLQFSTDGAQLLDREGKVRTDSWAQRRLEQPDNAERMVRVRMSAGQALRTKVDITFIVRATEKLPGEPAIARRL